MKKINIWYWIVTILFAGFMLMSGVSDALMVDDAKKLFNDLGMPEYLIRFIGIAKILGAITILMPGLIRIKEWAYAGLFFDLAGATFCAISAFGFDPMMLTMLIFFGLLFASYALHHKRLKIDHRP